MKTSYLMTYRENASPARLRNLETVLATLALQPELEVIVVEQDTMARLDADTLQGARGVFVYNAGPFNKSWGLNVAARAASSPHLIFGDADVLLPDGLAATLALLAQGVMVVKPYRRLFDLTATQTDALDEGQLPDAATLAAQPGDRAVLGEHLVLCGGVFGIQAHYFAGIGGWDERFVGWGGEDDALTMKIQRLRPSVHEVNALALHLHHPRAAAAHPHYASNLALLDQYRQLPDVVLLRLFELQKQMAGNPAKYSPPDLRGV